MRYKVCFLVAILASMTFALNFYSSEIERIVGENSIWSQFISYSFDDLEEQIVEKPLEYLYVTVLENDTVYGYSFQEMQTLSKEESIKQEPQLPIILQRGSPQGPEVGELGYGSNEANATIEQRGNSVRLADLKSFKIRLDEEEELWKDQDIINLNKHPYDFTRVRNKISFDYFEMIPDITTLDIQFVKLYVKDLTTNSPKDQFVDYGLFTHVEQPNKRFLLRNNLDPDGYLYKAIGFEFYRYPDKLRTRNDPLYNKEAFETVLGIRGREYHEKLINMLDDLNNEELDINKVISEHFDQDNMLTWMAVNIIMGNLDTTGNNFYLYSPTYGDKWYFLPWDYDKAWDYDWQWGAIADTIHPTRQGLSLYYGWPWVGRYFQHPENLQALNEKIDFLLTIITEKQTKQFLDDYYPIVRANILQHPDVQLLPEANVERFNKEYYSLINVPEDNKQTYYQNLEKPTPVFMGGPWFNDRKMTFTWSESIDLQGDEIFYDLQISKTPNFSTIEYEKTDLQELEWTMNPLPKGEYYWKITIRDSKGNKQIAFESFVDEEVQFYHGVKNFIIE